MEPIYAGSVRIPGQCQGDLTFICKHHLGDKVSITKSHGGHAVVSSNRYYFGVQFWYWVMHKV